MPCVVFEVGGGAPRECDWPGVVPKSNPLVTLTPFFILSSESLLFSLFATATCEAAWLGKLSRNWPKVSAGVSCERLRRRFFFNGTRLSSNSRLTVKAKQKKIRIPYQRIKNFSLQNYLIFPDISVFSKSKNLKPWA